MSKKGSAGCVTCKASNIRCDLTRGSTGCRRGTRVGIVCGGYLGTFSGVSKFKPKRSSKGGERQTSTVRRYGHSPNEIRSAVGRPAPNLTFRSGSEENSFSPTAINPEHDLSHPGSSHGDPISQQPHSHPPLVVLNEKFTTTSLGQTPVLSLDIPIPSIKQNTTPIVPPIAGNARVRPSGLMTEGQASLFDSILSLADNHPVLPCAAGNLHSKAGSTSSWPAGLDDDTDTDGFENVLTGLLNELVLDRGVESNIIPFVVQSCESLSFAAFRDSYY
ncbi:unnamed protein product [Rhizoctonia solani]|uniref:Zn(2)-C6 fungal-type domain-containing protein n=1 Tax=Rhizoctonia solani TaxID=456999 RepID=A0A8H3E4X8_9AGAM|nr:unnamed protein product [Rhizoctonia solani]